MADSIPSLRRKNKELADRISKLEEQLSQRAVEYVEVVREVAIPHPYAVETVREVNFPVDVPFDAPVYYAQEIPVEKIVYVDNPEHLEMIDTLQARIRELVDSNDE